MEYTNEESTIEEILEKGILIGSRQWGFNTDDSDWDIVITEQSMDNLKFKTNKQMGSKKDSFGVDRTSWVLNNKTSLVYQLDSGEVINFVVYKDVSYFELWRIINNMFEDMSFDRNNKTKIHRFVESTFSSLETFLEIGNPFSENSVETSKDSDEFTLDDLFM